MPKDKSDSSANATCEY